MKLFFRQKKFGISAKTSFINGVIVFIVLALTGMVILKFESNLSEFFIQYHISNIEGTIDEQIKIQKEALQNRMRVNAQIASGSAGIFVYNWDLSGLEAALSPYMNLPEIEAISITEAGGRPFFAIWKTPDIQTGVALPDTINRDKLLSDQADCYYEENQIAKIHIYYTDARLTEYLRQGKAQAQTKIKGFRNVIDERIQSAFFKQSLAILFVVLILIIGIHLSLKQIAIKPIRQMIDDLDNIADQFASSSEQILTASNLLAQNASVLADSTEKTSASLEKMIKMAQNTTTLTAGADQLMNKNIEKSGQSLKSLVDVTLKMEQIEKNNTQISHIIKTISEIASQTHLLSLNAAIEAARAGEAGSGFAVVADEVRNLAMKSSKSSKDTHELLRNTIDGITTSVYLIKNICTEFEDIIESATIMGEKTYAITIASKEQLTEIEIINTASDEIRKISQEVAARAEESASAADEFTSHAKSIKVFANQLKGLVGSTKWVKLRS